MKIGMFGHLGCSECMWFCKFFFLKKTRVILHTLDRFVPLSDQEGTRASKRPKIDTPVIATLAIECWYYQTGTT